MNVTDEIKARIDIVEFISRYVPLQKSGRTYKACCPFHQERTPSFIVFPHTGTWHCFGACSTGGDVFNFLMKRENLDFTEALKVLAKEAGVELEQTKPGESGQERDLLYEINALAAQYFRNILHRHSEAAQARAYLSNRGIDQGTAELFQLGFSLNGWDNLLEALTSKGYQPAQLYKAGLVKYHEERDSYYDAFRNRLIIPIRDRQGRVIGFGGRVLDDTLPKYLNTGETPLFHKSRVIYGLDLAHRAIRELDSVVIVEGYMDVIAAHQFGFQNVVACMGTAITEAQLQQLQRYTNNFVLALDADTAGQQATIRGLNQARQALRRIRKPVFTPGGRMELEERLAANLRIATLPLGKDPDDLVRNDPDAWRQLIEDAHPLVDFYFQLVAGQYDLETAQGKGAAVAEIAPLIAELSDDIERQHYVQQLSRLVKVDEQTIAHRVEAAAKTVAKSRQQRRQIARPANGVTVDVADQVLPDGERSIPDLAKTGPSESMNPAITAPLEAIRVDSGVGLETFLLANFLQEPTLLIWLAELAEKLEIQPLNSEDMEQPEHKEIFRALKRYISSDEQWDLELFQETLKPELHPWLAQLIVYATELPHRELSELKEGVIKAVIRMRLERLRKHLNSMQFLLRDAQQADDRESIISYSAAINRNRRERHHLQQKLKDLSRTSFGAE
jgi:DNA primase